VSTSSGAGPSGRDSHRLTDHDTTIIGRAHHIAGMSGPAAVRAIFGTAAVSYADTARAYAKTLDQATWVIGELLAIIERLADGTAATMDGERDEPPARHQPEPLGHVEATRGTSAIAPGGMMRIQLRTYEITFTGRAGDVLRAAFDDCTVTVGPGTTTLRAQLPDQAALWGLVQRIIGLGLEVVDLHLVVPE